MKLHAFEFVYKNERGVHTRTEGVAIASRLSGAESKTVLFDTRIRKKGSRCTDCEKNFNTLKHDTKTCPVKNRSVFIDVSVLPGHTAGVRNAKIGSSSSEDGTDTDSIASSWTYDESDLMQNLMSLFFAMVMKGLAPAL